MLIIIIIIIMLHYYSITYLIPVLYSYKEFN